MVGNFKYSNTMKCVKWDEKKLWLSGFKKWDILKWTHTTWNGENKWWKVYYTAIEINKENVIMELYDKQSKMNWWYKIIDGIQCNTDDKY